MILPICTTCKEDKRIFCPRDVDATCAHCGKSFCAAHMIEHLTKVHCVALDNEHCSCEKEKKKDGI